jgi:hypothetical protein
MTFLEVRSLRRRYPYLSERRNLATSLFKWLNCDSKNPTLRITSGSLGRCPSTVVTAFALAALASCRSSSAILTRAQSPESPVMAEVDSRATTTGFVKRMEAPEFAEPFG